MQHHDNLERRHHRAVSQRPAAGTHLLEDTWEIYAPAFTEVRIDLHPPEIRADLVVTLHNGARPVLGIIVEAQDKIEPEKRYSWPAYVCLLRRSLRANACLLVVTRSERVARWAWDSIPLGPLGSVLHPLVLGPHSMPEIEDVDSARRTPELAVLSAMINGRGDVDTAVQVALAAATAAHELDRDRFLLYFGFIRAALSEAARKAFDMNPQAVDLYG